MLTSLEQIYDMHSVISYQNHCGLGTFPGFGLNLSKRRKKLPFVSHERLWSRLCLVKAGS